MIIAAGDFYQLGEAVQKALNELLKDNGVTVENITEFVEKSLKILKEK